MNHRTDQQLLRDYTERRSEAAFAEFVRREDPKVQAAIEAIFTTGTQADAADWLRITESEFGRMRTRLGQLAKSFVSGEPVPRQRRPYKKRAEGR